MRDPHQRGVLSRLACLLYRLQRPLLTKLGIVVMPFYWTREGTTAVAPPVPQGAPGDYTFGRLGSGEMATIAQLDPRFPEEQLLSRLERGQLCFAVKHCGQIAAFLWCDLASCFYRWNRFALNDREAYLFGMHTVTGFRGRNIAPYLRHRVYAALGAVGRDTLYSVTEYFNLPAIRCKQKLDAAVLWLGVGIDFFGKVRRRVVIRRAVQSSRGPAGLQRKRYSV